MGFKRKGKNLLEQKIKNEKEKPKQGKTKKVKKEKEYQK